MDDATQAYTRAIWLHALAAAFFAAGGALLFLQLVNTRLLFVRRDALKVLGTVAGFVLLVSAPAVAGAWLGFSRWALIPAVVLALVAADEWRQARHRRRTRGMAPTRAWSEKRALMRPVTTVALDVIRYTLPCPGWDGPPFRVAHLSDLHIGSSLPDSFFAEVHNRVAAESPDLIFVTGDLVMRQRHTGRVTEILRPLRARAGVFAVLGNHDYWAGSEPVAAAVADAGIELLRNDWRKVELAPGHAITVRGCDAPWNRRPMRPLPPPDETPVFVLSHTADNVYDLSREGATAVFSGHYHGGQIRLPFIGPLVLPSVHGRRFVHGHFIVEGMHLFVSAGVGVASPPLRLYCPPDIFVVDIQPGEKPWTNST